MTVDILAIGAHPDDIELGCSGTLLKHISLGYKVGLLDLTHGELGTRGSGELRLKEAEQARQQLGAEFRINLNLADGFFKNNRENKLKLVEAIREYRPKIIFANAIADRHPDHGRGARLVADAVFLSGLIKIESRSNNQKQQPWRPQYVFHYIQDRYIQPDIIVDISGFMEKRLEVIKAFSSQFFDKTNNEPETPISSRQFLDSLYYRPLELGRMAGFEFGEGFTCEKKIGIGNLMDLGVTTS
ncbi:MAG: bacillithiol biosynthesis deacetylase BshB1 [Bacteroidia bacterium]|nr:bacillithiol biosynthesis deacetylase BshB1 [Bacteroidia bacterium]MCZ2277297.1 bacillithiol biosynthesis deacetylase BshB1 [Bacteroidia bacterium]